MLNENGASEVIIAESDAMAIQEGEAHVCAIFDIGGAPPHFGQMSIGNVNL
mgnify:CR=1 FL=1